MEAMNDPDDTNALARTAPTLHGLPKVDPFVVPEGFFERFPHQVGDAIVASERRSKAGWRPWMRWALAVPAVVVLVWFGLRNGQGVHDAPPSELAEVPALTSEELAEIADADVVAYMEEEGVAIDLVRVDVDLNDEEMLAYLATEEDIDLTELIIELE